MQHPLFSLSAILLLAQGGHALADTSATLSSFNDVRDVLLDKNVPVSNSEEEGEFQVYKAGKLPHYEVSASHFVERGVDVLLQRAVRTTTEKDDFYPRLKKLVHPNGACITGVWSITESSDYTGYFAKGSKALYVGRASTAMTETEKGHKRGFGFAGKLFPTMDPDAKVPTANFFSVDVLMGTKAAHYTDVSFTNEPSTGFDLGLIGLGLKIANTFKKADSNGGFRPLYPISELGMRSGASVKTPHWVMFRAEAGTAKIDEKDFRSELNVAKNYPNGLRYAIFVSDSTKDTSKMDGWKRVGQIDIKESMISYGCDRRLHFAHPKMK